MSQSEKEAYEKKIQELEAAVADRVQRARRPLLQQIANMNRRMQHMERRYWGRMVPSGDAENMNMARPR